MTDHKLKSNPPKKRYKHRQPPQKSHKTRQRIVPSQIQYVKYTIKQLDQWKPQPSKLVQSPHNSHFLKKAKDFLCNIEISLQTKETEAQQEIPFLYKPYAYLQSSNSWFPTLDLSEAPAYLKPSPLKDVLNTEFAQSHPEIDKRLTLSKILNLRQALICIGRQVEFEIRTTALAVSYFDRLLGKYQVNKANRRLFGSICMILAYKFNEEYNQDRFKSLLKKIEGVFGIQGKELFRAEYDVYEMLEFSLKIEERDFRENYLHVAKRVEVSVQD